MTDAHMAALTERVLALPDRQIHLGEQRGAEPGVVFLGGCGVAGTYWRDVVQLLPDRALTVLDRPGLGGTRWPGRLPTLADEVENLVAALRDRGPAVLVAHSMASFHAEALAREHPGRVAGLVLVDGSAEWPTRRPRRRGPGLAGALYRATERPTLRWLGGKIHRRGTALQAVEAPRVLHREQFRLAYSDPDALAMSLAEYLAYDEQAWELQRLRSRVAMPTVPCVVLSARRSAEPRSIEKQQRLARLLKARQVVVDDSRHMMMIDRPEVVARAVRSLDQP